MIIPMIHIDDLSMGYSLDAGIDAGPRGETITVLDRVSLTVAQGESVAIVGPSGSGKTTLLLLLAGLEAPRGGRVEVDGVDLATRSPDQLADLRRDRIGIVFQAFHLIASLTALNNVSMPLEMAGAPRARQRAESMLARVGLGHRSQHYPMQLSGGEQQRVAIARALVHEPAILLADEPTGNLDTRTGRQVSDLLFDLHQSVGSTMLLVTHDDVIARRCDRVLELADGQLLDRMPREVSG